MKKILLNKMLAIAAVAHEGQYDKGGEPYFLHCLAVWQGVRHYCEEIQCIALGHDLIEDTYITANDLYDDGMTGRIVRGILAMTKRKGQTYEEYKEQVEANPDAVIVKKSDLRHNSDLTRLKGVTEKDTARMVKYMKFYAELCAL